MILEGVVTTLDSLGALNVAPMGPAMDAGSARFILRPFQTSATFRNLQTTGAGVLHITDDVWLLARAAIKHPGEYASRPAATIPGRILATTGRFLEFRVDAIDASRERSTIAAVAVASGRQAVDLFGFNRARHAVVEAAILATRLDFLPPEEVLGEFARLAVLVAKTGGPDEKRAFDLLDAHVRARRGHP